VGPLQAVALKFNKRSRDFGGDSAKILMFKKITSINLTA
jgi:hypothetical protein